MQNSWYKHPNIQKTKQKVKLTAARLANQHINLAVTGLSRSGKTAFITSLVNQLLEGSHGTELPFFSVVRESRVVGVKRDVQPNLTFSRFAYEDAIDNLTRIEPIWPASTTGISQIRLKIKYKKSKGLGQLLSDDAILTIDITDYPGEWLLDLPLLEMNYINWSTHCETEWQRTHRNVLAQPFLLALENFDLQAKGDELCLQNLAELYAQYLLACQKAGCQLIQPGRFILPGELAGAPVLHFFPLPLQQLTKQNVDLSNPVAGSNAELLIKRFEHYKQQVVKPFYQQHFKRYDRQVVLVDCLSALNNGLHSYQDLQEALDWIMGSFHYGKSNMLKRLFKPKIDKLVFAATKADHITAEQHPNLVKLLDNMLHKARKQIQFESVDTETTAIAAIRASQSGLGQIDGQEITLLKGVNQAGKSITMYPGDVPQSCPSADFWQQHTFEFPKLAPPQLNGQNLLPHIRMDQVLDFLLSDKLT